MVKIIPSKISKPQSIRVLIVEDSEGDVLLIIRELKKGGYDPEYERVQTFPAMEKALKEEQWDIILCDYIMPEFNAPSAIALLKETNIDIPLIIVSGAIGEETAVECMRKGAHDYIMKTNLSRLCPAISRELVEADSRRIRKNVEVALRVSEERFRLVQDNSPDGFTILRPVRDAMWRVVDFTWIYENATIARLNGTEPNAVVGRSLLELFPEHRGSQSLKAYQQVAESGKNCIFESDFWSEGNTKPIWFRIVVVPTGENIAILAQDITERKLAEEALRESEELFSLFMRHSPVYTFIKEVTPTESRVLQASDNYEQMIGIPGPQMIGRTMAELFPPGFAAKITADDWTVVSRGNVIQQDEDLNGRNYASIKFPIIQRGKTLLAGYTIDITERKQAEEALINSEKKYRNLFENASEGIFQSTPEGRYISINPAFTKIGGYNSPDEMMASVTDIQKKMYVHQEDRTRLLELLNRHDIVTNFEVEIRRRDNAIIWISINVRAIRDRDHRIILLEGTIQDITGRKRSEKELQKSEDRYRSLYVDSRDAIMILSPDRGFISGNPAAIKLFACKDDQDFVTRSPESLSPEYQPDSVRSMDKSREMMRLALEKGSHFFEWTHRSANGTDFPATVLLSRLETGGARLLQATVRDITHLKQAEDALRESEEKFSTIFDKASDGILVTDAITKKFLQGNDSICSMLGYTKEEIKSLTINDIHLPKDISHVIGEFEKHTKGEKVLAEDMPVLRKDGSIFYADIGSAPATVGGIHCLVGIFRDITERKQAEKQLQQTLESLRRAVNTTMQVMVSAVEIRDPYTAGHQMRSANIARAIATEMGLPPEKIEGVHMVGKIHDIGKLSIPSDILSKSTKLSENEFSLIKAHAQRGFEMLKDVESPWPLAEIIYQHHERMDGSGYPRNLKGEDILMEARILAVADTVEAMASHRPYRPSLGIDAALNEIDKNKGLYYDETVADACLRLFREKGFQFPVA